ncbi:MAG: Beta-lactamase precursor [Syntrophorhabdus sp. PtaB.Bin047]|nr:MAG: Beta-lactamase precursor [Syntrophorhabdus sp. PtaB.Bin047]
MKTSFGICARLVLALVAVVLVHGQSSAADKLTRIAENVYAYVDTKDASPKNSFGANTGIIIGREGIVVVDTLVSAREAKRFIKDIRSVSKKPIRYVINTHHHLDHAFGNSEFVKLGAAVVAQENDRKEMERSAAETLKNIKGYGLTPQDMKGTKPAYPTVTYSERMTIDIGGEPFQLIHARHCHTGGDTLVYLRDKKVLFAGDILFTDYHPFIAEGNIEEWVRQLDEIASMDVEKIIPGHGPVSGEKDVEAMKEYIIAFDRMAKELAAKYSDPAKIAAELKSGLPGRRESAFLIGANVEMKYLKK